MGFVFKFLTRYENVTKKQWRQNSPNSARVRYCAFVSVNHNVIELKDTRLLNDISLSTNR